MSTIAVVPCYNEADRLPVDDFVAYAGADPSIAFLFVNDGSTDATSELLRDMHEKHGDRFGVLELEQNGGKAEAVRRGMLEALDRAPEYVGFWDADLATPLEEIPNVRSALADRPDALGAFAARVRLLGRSIDRQVKRHYLGRMLATMVGLILSVPVYDTQCGAKLFRAGPATRALFEEPFITTWVFDVEIVARLKQAHRRGAGPPVEAALVEVPLMHWRDVPGSKLRFRHMVGALFDLGRIALHYRPGGGAPHGRSGAGAPRGQAPE